MIYPRDSVSSRQSVCQFQSLSVCVSHSVSFFQAICLVCLLVSLSVYFCQYVSVRMCLFVCVCSYVSVCMCLFVCVCSYVSIYFCQYGLVLTGGHYHDIERYHDFKIMICIIMITHVPETKRVQWPGIDLALKNS